MKLPTWFIDALESDSDKELAKEGKLKALDKVIVCCQKCGKRIETIVKSKIVPANVNNPDYKIMCKCCAQRNDDELIGKRFGQLVVIKELAPDKDDNNQSRHRKVLCQCDCGKLVTPFLKNLRRGISTSCGKHRSKKTVIQHDVINKSNIEVLNDVGKIEEKQKEVVKSKANCSYTKKAKPKQSKFGFLRETSENAERFGFDKNTGICMTGLEIYLEEIYPDYKWIHDKVLGNIDGVSYKTRPDYRCEEYKLIVEFDGIAHYTSPDQILRDYKNTEIYERLGYKVIRIPYFIQLTNQNVEKIFGVKVYTDLFPVGVPSFSVELKNTPAYLCPLGIERMAREFKSFPDDYKTNIEYLKTIDKNLSGVDALENFYSNNV